MQVVLKDVKKKFIREWIIPEFSHVFEPNSSTAIIGANGSGKSTLLKLISGMIPPTKGTVNYFRENNEVLLEDSFRQFSMAAPYQQLIEEFTLAEFLRFHLNFRKFTIGGSLSDIAERIQLEDSLNKPIFFFSSGMKQRLKLGIALLSEASVTLLDEPTSNLDKKGIALYFELIESVIGKRTLIIASNNEDEYTFCNKKIRMGLK
uniref:ABC transporter ATP-binding protein n=1 Tax=Fulvivirga sp. TaxID=1931237 RepID=UPI00404AE178